MTVQDFIDKFYVALQRLQAKCPSGVKLTYQTTFPNGKSAWKKLGLPDKGVYLFFEEGEVRGNSNETQRVVRVGTHLSDNSGLENRLKNHLGKITSSAFCRMIAEAIKCIRNPKSTVHIENRITNHILSKMSFLVLPINPRDQRLGLEKKF